MFETLTSLLQSLFHGLEGDPIFCAGSDTLQTRDLAAVEKFADDHPDDTLTIDLALAGSAPFARAFHFTTEDEENACKDELGVPDLVLIKGDVDSVLVYFYSEAVPLADEGDPSAIDAIPVPARGGWTILDMPEPASAPEVPKTAPAPPPAPEEPSAPAASTKPFKHKNAQFVAGDLPAYVMDLQIQLGVGRHREDKKWPAVSSTFGQFVDNLCTHAVGEKEGKAFLQGVAVDHNRTAKAISALYIIGLDVDSGVQINPIVERIQNELKLSAVIYTTHSHNGTETTIPESSYLKFAKKHRIDGDATNETMARYMVEERNWEQSVAETIELGESPKVQVTEGIVYIFSHAPIPKFRIIFPLVHPYVIVEQKVSQIDAINRWKGKLLALAKMLRLPIDESCLDPSRLFYFPRHKEGGDFNVFVTSGAALDIDKVPEVVIAQRGEAVQSDDIFEQAAKDLGGETFFIGKFDLRRWISQLGQEFAIADMLRSLVPDHIRTEVSQDKIELLCPFDGSHSNAGDPEDRACFAVNAHGDNTDNKLVWRCQHNSCKNRDPLSYFCEAASQGWFDEDDLMDDRWRIRTVEPQQAFFDSAVYIDKAEKTINEFNKNTSRKEWQEIITDAVSQALTQYDMQIIVDAIAAKTRIPQKHIGEFMKEARRRSREKKAREQRATSKIELEKQAQQGKFKRIETIGPDFGYIEQRSAVTRHLSLLNHKLPVLFDYGGAKFYCQMLPDKADVNNRVAIWQHLANILSDKGDGLFFNKVTEDKEMSVGIPERILSEILEADDWECPRLTAFASVPFYTPGGALITKHGFNPETKIYLKPTIPEGALEAENNPTPTPEEVQAALDLLLVKVFGQFPFHDGSELDESGGAGSRAHFLALLLQPFIRHMINGPTPIYFISKPTPGTGGSLLAQAALTITSAKKASSGTDKDEAEQAKNITSAFRAGKSYYWVDNIQAELRSMAYCNLATASVWEDRTLGKSELVEYPNLMQFVLGGNNLRGTYEVMRRCLPIRLDFKGDPRTRKSFEIPDLTSYCLDNHHTLVNALLTLVNHWIASGKKPFSGNETMMSFESWASVTGGILESCGVKGFLTNLYLTQQQADNETSAWEAFGQAWYKKFKLDAAKSARDLHAVVLSAMPEYPLIGVTYNSDEIRMINNLRRVLDGKLGSPIKVKIDTEHGIQERTVTVKRTTDDETKMHSYGLAILEAH